MKFLKLFLGFLFGVCLPNANSAGIFEVNTFVNLTEPTLAATSFTNYRDAFNILTQSNLTALDSNYTGTESTAVDIDFRGVPVTAEYQVGGSASLPGFNGLTLTIPSLGISRVFDSGVSRDASQQLLMECLSQNCDNILSRLNKESAENSPVDPIAGNPHSMQTQMLMNDFSTGFGNFFTPSSPQNQKVADQRDIAFRFGQYRQGGITSNGYTLPLSYTFRNDLDPRRQLVVNMPLTLIDAARSMNYMGAFGGAYRFPMNNRWMLTPAVNFGVSSSADLGSAFTSMVSGSLTSSTLFRLQNFDIVLGNMVGYYTTVPTISGNFIYNPGIANTVVRNGLMLSHPVSLAGRTMSLEYSVIDTHLFGDKLYINHFNEIGVSIGTNRSAGSVRDHLRARLNGLFSSKSSGFSVTFGYWF